ncbi:MAG: hypothetical protein IT239_00910 [Bacteroidia bacterium]|nr:hypothetical protein [Bacteroidia bacterium]
MWFDTRFLQNIAFQERPNQQSFVLPLYSLYRSIYQGLRLYQGNHLFWHHSFQNFHGCLIPPDSELRFRFQSQFSYHDIPLLKILHPTLNPLRFLNAALAYLYFEQFSQVLFSHWYYLLLTQIPQLKKSISLEVENPTA